MNEKTKDFVKADNFRERIFQIIEVGDDEDIPSKVYDFFMMAVIIISLVPLFFKSEPSFFLVTDYITAGIFVIDYLLRLMTADFKLEERHYRYRAFSFVRYPFTLLAIIDLVSILPTFAAFHPALKALKVFRLLRTFKVFRIFKGFRYSKTFEMIYKVIKEHRQSLLAVCGLAIGYIIIVALVMFNVEPDTFDTYFDAVYWATVSLTTMGYGDIYATSTLGQAITMVSALFGIAIVAMPAGIISAGFMAEINERKFFDRHRVDIDPEKNDEDII